MPAKIAKQQKKGRNHKRHSNKHSHSHSHSNQNHKKKSHNNDKTIKLKKPKISNGHHQIENQNENSHHHHHNYIHQNGQTQIKETNGISKNNQNINSNIPTNSTQNVKNEPLKQTNTDNDKEKEQEKDTIELLQRRRFDLYLKTKINCIFLEFSILQKKNKWKFL